MAKSRPHVRTRWLTVVVLALAATLLQIAPAGAQGPGGHCTLTPLGDGSASLEWNVDGGSNRETSIRVDDRWLFTAAVGETTATIDDWNPGSQYSIRQWKQETRFDFACGTPAPLPTPQGWCTHAPAENGLVQLDWHVEGGDNRESNIRVNGDWVRTLAPGVASTTVDATAGDTIVVRQWKQANLFEYPCVAGEQAEDATDTGEEAEEHDGDDEAAEGTEDAGDAIGEPVDLPPECEFLFLPAATDVATNNISTLGLVDVLDRFGADVGLFGTPDGFVFGEWDYQSAVVSAIATSWYQTMTFPDVALPDFDEEIPIECFGPIPEEELAQQQAYVDAVVAAFTEAGIAHEVVTDGPFTFVEFDFDDPEAAAIEFAIAEEIFGPFDEIPEEELEFQRAFNDALAEAFTNAGVEFERVTLPDGWEIIEYDFEDENALQIEQEVAEEFFGPFGGDFDPNLCFVPEFESGFFPPFEPRELSDAELAVIEELNTAIAGALDAIGADYTVFTDGAFPQISWDFLDRTANAAADEAYRAVVGDALLDDDFIPADVLEQIQIENDALAVAFDNAGVPYMVVTDEFGFTTIEYDFTDEEAQAIAAAVLEELYGPFEGIPEAELERMAAEVAALSEAFDAAGIAYVLIEDPFGGQYIEFDYEDAEAFEIYDQVQMDLYYAPCDEIPGFVERVTTLEQLAAELEAAGVQTTLIVEGPYVDLTFDLDDPAAVAVVSRYL